MKTDQMANKESFIQLLSIMTPEEINKMIEQKGKKPKPIPMVIFH